MSNQTDNLYSRLGVSPKASKQQIKKAFRDKARTAHPDKGGRTDDFIRLQLAYDVLGDDDRRKRYDTLGETDRKRSEDEEAAIMVVQSSLKFLDSHPDNFIATAKISLEQERDKLSRDIKEFRDKSRIYKERAARVKKRGDGENLIQIALLQHSDQASRAVLRGEEHMSVLCKAILIAEQYELEGAAPTVRNFFQTGTPMWTGT